MTAATMESTSWDTNYSAFENQKLIAQGNLIEVAMAVKLLAGKASHSSALVFSHLTGNRVDLNLHGSEKEVLKRLQVFTSEEPSEGGNPGRPKLGVVSREVSLMPGHWEWLATQSGGASATLRRLVEEAKRKALTSPSIAQMQERVYRFLHAMAGDLPGYEAVLRGLYRRDSKTFLNGMAAWPPDIKTLAERMAQPLFVAKPKPKAV